YRHAHRMPRRAVPLHQLRLVRDRVARPVVTSVDGISQVTGDLLVTSHPHHLSVGHQSTSERIDVSTRTRHTRSGEYIRMYSSHVGTKVPPSGCIPAGAIGSHLRGHPMQTSMTYSAPAADLF